MHFLTLLIALLTLGAGVSAVKPKWDDLLKVWDIGKVPKINGAPLNNMGNCGSKIKEGGWACGRFPNADSQPRVIYTCQDGRLRRRETCKQGTKNDACVRNWRKKGRAFYPFVEADNLVCVQKKDANKA
jgi:hypothetical protein